MQYVHRAVLWMMALLMVAVNSLVFIKTMLWYHNNHIVYQVQDAYFRMVLFYLGLGLMPLLLLLIAGLAIRGWLRVRPAGDESPSAPGYDRIAVLLLLFALLMLSWSVALMTELLDMSLLLR